MTYKSLNVLPSTHKRVKILSAEIGCTIDELILRLLSQFKEGSKNGTKCNSS